MRNALVLYMYDHLNNFIQVELRDGRKMVAKFNRYDVISNQTKNVKGEGLFEKCFVYACMSNYVPHKSLLLTTSNAGSGLEIKM